MTLASTGRDLVSRIGVPVNAAFPRLTWNVWGIRRSAAQLSVESVTSGAQNQWRQHARRGSLRGASGPPHLLYVVPARDSSEQTWLPGVGNHTYDLVESARDVLGRDRVSVVNVEGGASASTWHEQILDYVSEHRVTHVMAQIEHDPADAPEWTWDVMLKALRSRWGGTFVALSYDSAYPYILMHIDRVTRVYARSVAVALDRPLQGLIRPNRPAVGPLFLPIANESLRVLDEATEGLEPRFDLTFIGNVDGYEYRRALLDDMVRAGVEVTVNPQFSDEGVQPGFASYARVLKRSRITLNFSRCNGVPVTQLKTRILEGSLFGSVVASDSPLYAEDYFRLGKEFIAYHSYDDLKRQVTHLLGHPDELEAMRAAARARAMSLYSDNFWNRIDLGLAKRELPTLR